MVLKKLLDKLNSSIGKFFCNKLDWHISPMIGFDGASALGMCERCKQRLLMDSQGNWFKATIQDKSPTEDIT